MREKLNNNPIMQVAVIGVLLVAGGIFLMSTMGGGEEAVEPEAGTVIEEAAPEAANPIEGSVETLEAAAPSAGATLAALPPTEPPAPVVEAYESGATVALLFIREGGIDDRLVRDAAAGLAQVPDVVSFVVPAREIAEYTAITGGVGVERVPALVVLTPKRVSSQVPTASVLYGYQSPASVVQAVIDAGYKGPTLDYHP
ncbi:MAG TPA: hypothetical protein VD741_09330 [Solirubrobacterales bacterium]|nr:hypothetical protein [Solirubrobacterales bacterium]